MHFLSLFASSFLLLLLLFNNYHHNVPKTYSFFAINKKLFQNYFSYIYNPRFNIFANIVGLHDYAIIL